MVMWSGIPISLRIVCVIYRVRNFSIVSEAEIDVFLEFSCFFCDPTDVGNLISGSSAFSKSSLNIWKFSVHTLLKQSFDNNNCNQFFPNLKIGNSYFRFYLLELFETTIMPSFKKTGDNLCCAFPTLDSMLSSLGDKESSSPQWSVLGAVLGNHFILYYLF